MKENNLRCDKCGSIIMGNEEMEHIIFFKEIQYDLKDENGDDFDNWKEVLFYKNETEILRNEKDLRIFLKKQLKENSNDFDNDNIKGLIDRIDNEEVKNIGLCPIHDEYHDTLLKGYEMRFAYDKYQIMFNSKKDAREYAEKKGFKNFTIKSFKKDKEIVTKKGITIEVLKVLEEIKKSATRLQEIWVNSVDTMGVDKLIELMSLNEVIPMSFDDYIHEVNLEIKKKKTFLEVPKIDKKILEDLLHKRFKSIKDLEEHVGIEFEKITEENLLSTDYMLASKKEANTDYKKWGEGYIIITYLKEPFGENQLFITECWMN